jgi:hypothetical protein
MTGFDFPGDEARAGNASDDGVGKAFGLTHCDLLDPSVTRRGTPGPSDKGIDAFVSASNEYDKVAIGGREWLNSPSRG